MLVLGVGVWSGNSTSKSFLAAGNDDCADVFVRVVGCQGIIEFFEERAGERVEGFGSVEGDCFISIAVMVSTGYMLVAIAIE